VIPACQREGLGLVVYSPLAQGILTGKYASLNQLPMASRAADDKQNFFIKRVLTEESLKKANKIAELAKRVQISPANLALAWCLRQQTVSSVIIGASRPEQVADNVKSSGLVLSEVLLKEIEGILG